APRAAGRSGRPRDRRSPPPCGRMARQMDHQRITTGQGGSRGPPRLLLPSQLRPSAVLALGRIKYEAGGEKPSENEGLARRDSARRPAGILDVLRDGPYPAPGSMPAWPAVGGGPLEGEKWPGGREGET